MIESHENPVVTLECAEFSTRFEVTFNDLASHAEDQAITKARELAWQAYMEARLLSQPMHPATDADLDCFL